MLKYIYALLCAALLSASSISIAWNGDWGYPQPFTFYPRGPGYVITSFIYDTLLWKDSHGVIPWLASSWKEITPSHWIVKLRRGVKWFDGREITSDDVVFSFNYLKKHEWRWMMNYLNIIKDVRKIDKYTVEFILKRPMPLFDEIVLTTVFILPKHIWEKVEDPLHFLNRDAFRASGPYVLENYIKGLKYILNGNEVSCFKPKYDRVELIILRDPNKIALALLSHTVDAAMFWGKAWRIVNMLKDKFHVKEGQSYWVLYLDFNKDIWPTSCVHFRRGVRYLLDLKKLAKMIGGVIPGTSAFIPPYSKWYNPNTPHYSFNVTKALAEFKKCGIKVNDGKVFLRKLSLVTTKNYLQEAYFVAQSLKKVGIDVKIRTFNDFKQLDMFLRSGQYDLAILGHGATGNNPYAFSWFFTTWGTPWENEKFKTLINSLFNAKSIEELKRIVFKIQELVAKELPQIALYYPKVWVVYSRGDWFFTYNGIDGGIPLPWNKLSLVKDICSNTQ